MPSSLTISIAMCTYNGERFVQEQLESFSAQTRLPDEVVICDDSSQDNTLALLHDFASRAPFPVRIFINPENLGVAKNFEKAISLCSGDITALSDQDDVWLPEKLAIIERTFEASPEVGCVFSDAMAVDEHLQPLHYSLWDAIDFKPRYRNPAQKEFHQFILKGWVIAGATMAFRTQLVRPFIPFPADLYHDEWLSFVFCASAEISVLPHQLNKYRQHAAQCYGVKRASLFEELRGTKHVQRKYYLEFASRWVSAISLLCSHKDLNIKKIFLTAAIDQIKHLQARATMPGSLARRLPLIWQEAINGRYHRCSNGMRSILKDLLLFEQI
ncbi:MAG: glycosyltransferase family 2 protein [Deltaproteobacteria bacterium]|nr:glycosyltransferase family 2 protein [Deltaproteobacteria bacterium]